MENNYTKAQIKDITSREKKGIELLKELKLTPASIISKTKMQTTDGAEVFADQLTPYLQDTKYVRKSDGTYEERMKVTESTPNPQQISNPNVAKN